ncbi:helix-turn-helix domain-containing protein [Pelodictyon phaeoclathratiforme]|jgi:cytoskeletal protein RodZ|uniref:HTH cro/C1-type domain-containing protein n=1 Tax=Pelodictyon phaeoclathratiforme (strain DSM 5477 / BU-1) TaxID=324925 RepID=B4SAY3_PELPB|nr:helix-turn-helix domain-containing protein [Pelodictyon phaeoclathratiforme]ACF43929.1 conserved hypothetical protein [Pelodictyon phaeoclathratiforme BU-1]MBV5288392.1 helix-turn-helix domain-containing protein [Pelodictyon phaeoclathratiforme]
MKDILSHNDSLEFLVQELKTARLEKNLSIDDVSRLTNIKKNYLENIENGNFSFLPKSYVFACIKSYMKEIGLEGFEALEQCKKDLQLHKQLNKEEIAKSGSELCETKPQEQINRNNSQPVKSILTLSIGILVGVLTGVGLSYRNQSVEAPVHRLPATTARPSVNPVDTNDRIKQRSDSTAKIQRKKSLHALIP